MVKLRLRLESWRNQIEYNHDRQEVGSSNNDLGGNRGGFFLEVLAQRMDANAGGYHYGIILSMAGL